MTMSTDYQPPGLVCPCYEPNSGPDEVVFHIPGIGFMPSAKCDACRATWPWPEPLTREQASAAYDSIMAENEARAELDRVVHGYGLHEVRALLYIARRIAAGQITYGHFDPATDQRDFRAEGLAELADALVYGAFDALRRAALVRPQEVAHEDDHEAHEPAEHGDAVCPTKCCGRCAGKCAKHAEQIDDDGE
jgi:hypothetical protein